MAETVHLYLKANGADIKGESSQVSLSRADSIECLYFEHEVGTAREGGSGLATGRRQYKPLVIRKRIDKSTPLLAKALCDNEKVEGVFKFFRPNPTGDGTTEQFYTIEFKNGRMASFKQISPDSSQPALSTMPEMEEVSIIFHTISWTYTNGGITHEDTWDNQK
jgi:type VI secretion system secreted protein Hcp